MICPECGWPDTKVKESRTKKTTLRRRRECEDPKCKCRFTTYEYIYKSGPKDKFKLPKIEEVLRWVNTEATALQKSMLLEALSKELVAMFASRRQTGKLVRKKGTDEVFPSVVALADYLNIGEWVVRTYLNEGKRILGVEYEYVDPEEDFEEEVA